MNAGSRVNCKLLLICIITSAFGVVIHTENAGTLPITMGTISGSGRSNIDNGLGGNCTDFKRQPVGPGDRFVPLGYDACTTCTCEQGRPEMCLSMLCSPPKECANLVPLDDKCCEFECFDMGGGIGHSGGGLSPSNVTVPGVNDVAALNATNLGLRLVASTITSFLILALLLFMIHRLRQRRLLLMIRRINASQVVGMPYGDHRYAMGEDGSVGYFTGHDHVDFPPYDDPPPPYTFWKPPDCFFPREEAPPPYDVSQQLNNSMTRNQNDRNHLGVTNYHSVQVAYPLPFSPPVNYIPHQQTSDYANLPLTMRNGIIPSLTQVSLRTNNFQMNDLDQETGDTGRRHSVPVRELNVVGSRTSLNSSQSELNMEPPMEAIRSDDIYEEHGTGILPPLLANVVTALSSSDLPALRSKWEEEANLERHCPILPLCNDIDRNRVVISHDSHKSAAGGKQCGLRSQSSNLNFCPDPTSWEGDASETSSSSSPTFERTTMSPTSSDSSSIDYTYGQHRHSPRTVVPFTGRKSSLPCLMTATQSSPLDCTLDSIRSKIYIKGPGKLRRLLGGQNSASDLCTNSVLSQEVQRGQEEVALSSLPQVAQSDARGAQCSIYLNNESNSAIRSSQQKNRHRPRSYDFADLCSNQQNVCSDAASVVSTYPIAEETSTSTESTNFCNPLPVARNTGAARTKNCCSNSYVTDHFTSSVDSFGCTCSIARTPSREDPASLSSSPLYDKDCPCPVDEHMGKGVTRSTISRSGSICSETGEPRRQSVERRIVQNGIINAPVSIVSAVGGQDLEDISEVRSVNAASEERTSPLLTTAPAHSCVRVALGSFKGSHESYI